MKLVTLQPVEGSQKSVEIKVGRTIIGRGPLLECADKKVSRNHAVIEVRESGDIYLTPTHVNPCFYLPNDSNKGFEVLKKDCPQLIHNGDSFSLLPNGFRYRVSVSDVSDYESIESEKNIAATAAAVAAASTTAANKVKDSASTPGSNTTSGAGNKKDEALLNGENKKDPKEDDNHKANPVEESPKDNGKPTPPVKNGLSPVRASSRRIESKNASDKDLSGLRDQQHKTQAALKQNCSDSPDLAEDTTPSASVKEKESKSRDSRKAPVAEDSKSDRKTLPKGTPNSSVPYNSKDKSPLASKKILSEKSAAKKDVRKEKTDSEKQKQLKNFDFDDEDDDPVVKPAGKKPAQKTQAKKPAERSTAGSASVPPNPSTSKRKEPPSRKRSPPPSRSSVGSASGSRSTRTHRTLIQRISLDDFMASDEEWIATYASSDEERKKARKRLAKRKSAAEASSDEDDWSGKKTKKRQAKKSRKTNTDDENDDSEDDDGEEEEEVKPKRSRGRTSTAAARKNKKKAKVTDVSESSDESKNDAGSDDADEDEVEKSKAPSKKAQAPKKKEAPKTASGVRKAGKSNRLQTNRSCSALIDDSINIAN
ncbi:aprataxin and PNK-like factor [Galendromus occidentalis]|uniref:Aprataxin and PNK-like factor n=1 Tax=Galendromus occidentalis TaxID=34638 RepID=A0AAJ7P9X1_9ACAR|nr:aprataxin and PNK-like factor [Galendromus occidentalis]